MISQDRWRLYGAPRKVIPEQEKTNGILKDLLINDKIEEIRLLPLCKMGKRISKAKLLQAAPHKECLMEFLCTIKEKIPPFWLEQREIKEILKRKQETHETETLSLLLQKETEPSISCQIYTEWELTRGRIKEIMQFLDKDRKLQTTFNNLIGATRFETMEKGQLYITICPRCNKQLDNWEHHKECYGLQVPNKDTENTKKEWLATIKGYMLKITTDAPAKHKASCTKYEEIYGLIAQKSRNRGSQRERNTPATQLTRQT